MITLEKTFPEVYYKMSRDFQVIGRIYIAIFNYLKANRTIFDNLPLSNNSDSTLLELLSYTLGFESCHQYNNEQLAKLCSIFIECMRNKGNLKAVQMVLNMLCSLTGEDKEAYIEQDEEHNGYLNLFVPKKVTDFILFNDVMDYIMPAGVIYRVINTDIIDFNLTTKNITPQDTLVSGTSMKFNYPDNKVSVVFRPDKVSDLEESIDGKNVPRTDYDEYNVNKPEEQIGANAIGEAIKTAALKDEPKEEN